MIARKLLSSADLARAQALCINELSKIIMVSINEDLMFATF